jgi:sepiapterin reductase
MTTVYFITGASRGFGAAVVEALARGSAGSAEAGSLVLVLVARDAEALGAARARALTAAPAARVAVVTVDLAQLEAVEAGFAAAAAAARACLRAGERIARAALINNAGSGGPVGAVEAISDLAALRAAVDLNVTSCVWLTALFLRFARAEPGLLAAAPEPPSEAAAPAEADSATAAAAPWRCAVVNVSSLCAIEPFATLGAYCAGKAARDMLHRVVAAEGAAAGVAALNWAPGPMATALQAGMRGDAAMDAGLRAFFEGLEASGSWVREDASAAKLARLLETPGAFKSGAHLDYYDVN